MITCSKCKCEKDETLFNWRVKGVKRKTYCKECEKAYKTKYYEKNKEEVKARAKECTAKTVKEMRKYVSDYKAERGCLVCNEKEAICLDLHHVDGTEKEGNVSDMIGDGLRKKVLIELKKCVVLCSNCHRKVHADLINLDDYDITKHQ